MKKRFLLQTLALAALAASTSGVMAQEKFKIGLVLP